MEAYLRLIKFTLSFFVVFSYVVSYLIAMKFANLEVDFGQVVLLAIAGFCITGSANATNQLIEQHTDKLMLRTKNRPIVSGAISPRQARFFIAITLLVGIGILIYFFQPLTVVLALFSFILYVYVYTPMKRYSSFAVFIGAFPGSLPCLIGWVAATGMLDVYGWILFGVQFFWQFPHFWSLAWIVYKDYEKAGYRLLPFGLQPGKIAAYQTFAFTVPLLVVSMIPYLLFSFPLLSLLLLATANICLCVQVIRLCVKPTTDQARQLMFTCYVYLPIVFLAYLI